MLLDVDVDGISCSGIGWDFLLFLDLLDVDFFFLLKTDKDRLIAAWEGIADVIYLYNKKN